MLNYLLEQIIYNNKMLPSTGLFKTIVCPFYCAGEGISCYRPHCHFKHVRKDGPANDSIKPHDSTALKPPKLLTLTETAVKKKKLEYTPSEPGINVKKSSSNNNIGIENTAPVYVPSESLQSTAAELANIDLNDCDEELKELSEIFGEEENCTDVIKEIKIKIDQTESTNPNCIEKQAEPVDQIDRLKRKSRENVTIETKELNSKSSTNETKSNVDVLSSKHKERSKESKDFKLKHSTKDKKKEKHKHRQDNDRKEHVEICSILTECSEKRENTKTDLSSTNIRRHTSSLKHRLSPDINPCLDKNEIKKIRHSSSSASTGKHRSSSCRLKTKEQSKKSSGKLEKSSLSTSTSSDELGFKNLEQLFPTSEEDIRKECEMIYDQMEQHFASLHETESHEQPTTSKTFSKEQEQEKYTETLQHRKRISYQNSVNAKPLLQIAPRKPNHIKNTLKSVYDRQEEARKKQEEKNAAIKEAEEKVREANEALRKIQEKELTRTIPRVNLHSSKPSSFIIAPVTNILALERARKKVEELKAEGMRVMTPSQTASKAGSRVAHTSTIATKVIPPKPPVLEAESTKISYNIRMQYYEIMVKHCTVIYPNTADAWDRAQSEELAVFKKCNTPVIYKNSAMLTINKLRKESIEAGNKVPDNNKVVSHEVILAGKLAKSTSWSVAKKTKYTTSANGENFDKIPGHTAYEMVYELRLTEEQLESNGFPRPGSLNGMAVFSNTRSQIRPQNKNERYCKRCSKVFDISMYDSPAVDECNFHPKSTGYRRGYADNQHRCCQQLAGSPGCSYANYHVSEEVENHNLMGYVTTMEKEKDYVPSKKDIYALDCEMCYTTHGIELTRVTVVDINARTVYDALVKPEHKIIDYNTIYSGITEQMMENETRTLRDVQSILLSMFHSKTILIGHSLESDLKALKLIHSVVVDTSVLFPHKMGPPKKRALKTLCIENLKRIIQESESGHDSAEDAEVCIQLVKFYLRNRIS